jgi:hypothetical protein
MCIACFLKKKVGKDAEFLGCVPTFPIALLPLNLKAGATEKDTNA